MEQYEDIKKKFRETFRRIDIVRMNMPVTWERLMNLFEQILASSYEPEEYKEKREENIESCICGLNSNPEILLELKLLMRGMKLRPGWDFLGQIYKDLKIGNDLPEVRIPRDIIDLIAKMTALRVQKDLREKKFSVIEDLDCGSGELLLRIVHHLQRLNVNYRRNVLFVAKTENEMLAKMTYIQLSATDCPAYVVTGKSDIAGTLFQPEIGENKKIMFTPYYHAGFWAQKTEDGTIKLNKKQ